jgi:hypothetical protein
MTQTAVDVHSRAGWTWPAFAGLLLVQLWAAHALAFFPHEYAHSFTAWLLGWKSNPLALYYAHPTLVVFLAQLGINQDVNEAPIFASGHGHDAAIIAAAGMVIGNGLISLPLSRLGYAMAERRGHDGWAMFFYWITVASLGNFIDYVPVRTFTDEGDMGSIQRGFGWSPWTVLLVLGLPTAMLLLYFFFRVEPVTIQRLFPNDKPKQTLILLVTAGVLFGFYGAAGLLEGGPVSHRVSQVSVYVVLPMVIVISWLLLQQWSTKETS